MQKIGRIFLVVFYLFPLVHAAELNVYPSSTEITEDENLSIEFKVFADSMSAKIGTPAYSTPDFDEVNVYSRSTSVESTFINGSLTVRKSQGIMVVLHPKKTGKLAIRNISISVEGKVIRANDLVIDVAPSGTARKGQPGSSYVGSAPKTLPNAGIQSGGEARSTFFIKTEPNKLKVYKGEQIVVTYSLYTRTSVLGIQVERYPTFPGFLKEDMNIPVLTSQMPDFHHSVVGGQEYNRGVLAQYAIFAVKEGNLTIDPFTAKLTYRRQQRFFNNEDDDLFGVTRFFQALQTMSSVVSSNRVTVEVLPLPATGQPQGFLGLVGDFNITAAVDKTTTKVGEPINVKIKIEGSGHAGSLERLSTQWPTEFEQYEDKSNTVFQKTGHSERTFEYMLVPKIKGKFQIPAIEISMFSPEAKNYVSRSSQPIEIEVLEGSLGNFYIPKDKQATLQPSAKDIRFWMTDDILSNNRWRWLARGAAIGSILFLMLAFYISVVPRSTLRHSKLKQERRLLLKAQALMSSQKAGFEILSEAEDILQNVLRLKFGIQIGSLTRQQVVKTLVDKSVSTETAQNVEKFLERCENMRFVPSPHLIHSKEIQQTAAELYPLVEKLYRV